jgi:hypothetical protein
MREGLLAPVFASGALFGAYLLIKFTDFNIQAFLNLYFWLIGSIALSGAAQPVLRKVSGAPATGRARCTGRPSLPLPKLRRGSSCRRPPSHVAS